MSLKLSCQEQLGVGPDFAERCQMLSELGFDAVEIWGRDLLGKPDNVSEYKKILNDCRLNASVVVVGYQGCLLSANPAERNQAKEGIRELLQSAGILEAVGLIVVPIFHGPQIPDLTPIGNTVELEDHLMVECLKELGPVAAAAGTKLILEPLNRAETHYLNTLAHAAELIDNAGGEGLALMGDTYHMNIEEISFNKTFAKFADKLAHVHFADNTRGIPGSGMIDFHAIINTLESIDYQHYVSFEWFFKTDDKKADLENAINYLRSE